MNIKTFELSGIALDWAVAKADGWQDYDKEDKAFYSMNGDFSCCRFLSESAFNPSTSWAQGGMIIEIEHIEIYYHIALGVWAARYEENLRYGSTPLIAAMRCYVASKLGESVDIPDGLI